MDALARIELRDPHRGPDTLSLAWQAASPGPAPQSAGSLSLPQVARVVLGIAGAALTLWCVVVFAWLGKGTPLPFDPRRLVVRGPYRAMRNPMAIGVGRVCHYPRRARRDGGGFRVDRTRAG